MKDQIDWLAGLIVNVVIIILLLECVMYVRDIRHDLKSDDMDNKVMVEFNPADKRDGLVMAYTEDGLLRVVKAERQKTP